VCVRAVAACVCVLATTAVAACVRLRRALQWRDGSKQMPLDDILRVFAGALAAKGKVESVQAAMGMNRCGTSIPPPHPLSQG